MLKTFKAFEESTEEQKYTITEKILSDNRWLEAYLRFSHVMFNNENKFENKKIFFDLLIDASTEKPKISDNLNQDWFKKLCIELIKKDLFEYIFKNLAQSKIFRTLKMITYAVCSDSELVKLISERSNLIELTNQELIDSIFEAEEIIINMMDIYTSTADYNEKTTISSKLYFLLKIFINAQKELKPQLNSLLKNAFKYESNNVRQAYIYGDVLLKNSDLYIKTLLKVKDELKNFKQERWDFLIEIFSSKNAEMIEDNDNIDFILNEMKKIR
ncbi:hypothetical protein [Shewanella baltica]|uniref:hypothetical protein n=1 Tax=Shewanella baltica TaxID=62322 RepID=UPI00217D12C7|nr:hypothetical protein [Shewanella baltica]MCS6097830.1 hypothetical protein [Shewanella baltica]MCS6225270.1 hypothetical protein [Shewanella baltica]